MSEPGEFAVQEIPVWDACGMLGWYIPWAHWKSHRTHPLVPTRVTERPYVYLYSKAGQFYGEHFKIPSPGFLKSSQGPFVLVDLDTFINPSTQEVDWPRVSLHIRSAYLDAKAVNATATQQTPQGPTPPEAEPEKAE